MLWVSDPVLLSSMISLGRLTMRMFLCDIFVTQFNRDIIFQHFIVYFTNVLVLFVKEYLYIMMREISDNTQFGCGVLSAIKRNIVKYYRENKV